MGGGGGGGGGVVVHTIVHTKLNYFSYKLFWEKGKTHIAENKKKKSTSMIFPCSAFKPQPTNSSTQS